LNILEGSPLVIIPDNTKTAVITPDVTKPVLNRSYNDMANHYSAAIVPARKGKAKDKDYASYCTSPLRLNFC